MLLLLISALYNVDECHFLLRIIVLWVPYSWYYSYGLSLQILCRNWPQGFSTFCPPSPTFRLQESNRIHFCKNQQISIGFPVLIYHMPISCLLTFSILVKLHYTSLHFIPPHFSYHYFLLCPPLLSVSRQLFDWRLPFLYSLDVISGYGMPSVYRMPFYLHCFSAD